MSQQLIQQLCNAFERLAQEGISIETLNYRTDDEIWSVVVIAGRDFVELIRKVWIEANVSSHRWREELIEDRDKLADALTEIVEKFDTVRESIRSSQKPYGGPDWNLAHDLSDIARRALRQDCEVS